LTLKSNHSCHLKERKSQIARARTVRHFISAYPDPNGERARRPAAAAQHASSAGLVLRPDDAAMPRNPLHLLTGSHNCEPASASPLTASLTHLQPRAPPQPPPSPTCARPAAACSSIAQAAALHLQASREHRAAARATALHLVPAYWASSCESSWSRSCFEYVGL